MAQIDSNVHADAEALVGEQARSAQLRRGLGLLDCVLLVIGSMVGSGIFLTTGQIAGSLPAPWLILLVWLIGGAMALAGALTYAELGAALPHAGGHYVYLREAYGRLAGFLDGWLSVVASFPGSIAFVAVGIMAYLPAGLSGHRVLTMPLGGWAIMSDQLVALGLVAALSLVNGLGLRIGSGTQNVLTALKLAALLGISIAGFCCARDHWGNLAAVGTPGAAGFSLAGMGAALIGVSFAYLGWDASTYMAAEVRQPQRVLPRSLLLGTGLVVGTYLLFNAVLLYGLPLTDLAHAGNTTQAVVVRLLGPGFAGLVGAAVVICIVGSLNATVMIGPRIAFAMAEDGLMPDAVARVSPRTHVPVVAIVIQAIWSAVIILCSSLGHILAFTVLVIWLLSAVTGAAVFVLRHRRPDLPRPYRTWGYPWVPAFFCLTSTALMINHLWHTPTDALWLLGFMVASIPVYRFMTSRRPASFDTSVSHPQPVALEE